MNYWQSRQEKANKARADKAIEDIEEQLKKYYADAMKRTIADFESTYDKILTTIETGKEVTPADLYKLDKYWQMQAQLKEELQKLGDKEIALLSREFEKEWIDIYKSISFSSEKAFSTVSVDNAKAMINAVWLSDGKTFSQRIWNNTEELVEALNEQLIHCVVTGKKTTELKELLQERFNVSYNRASTLVRTEVAHIETAAAAQRYKDYGLTKYEFLGRDEHDIGCNCKKLDGKVFLYSEMQSGVNAPPIHPNCRCAIIPVIDDDEMIMEDNEMEDLTQRKCISCGKKIKKGHGSSSYDYLCDDCKGKEPYGTYKRYKAVKLDGVERTPDEYEALYPEKFYKPQCTICGKEIERDTRNGIICKECEKKVYELPAAQTYKKKGKNNNSLLIDFLDMPYENGGYAYPTNTSLKKNWILYEEFYKKQNANTKRKLRKWKDDGDLENHLLYCVDCGKLYIKTSNSSKRCESCQAEYRKKYKAQKERERRKKKKENKK